MNVCLCSIQENGTREKDRTFENVCIKNFHIYDIYIAYVYTHTHEIYRNSVGLTQTFTQRHHSQYAQRQRKSLANRVQTHDSLCVRHHLQVDQIDMSPKIMMVDGGRMTQPKS